jgi:hypothetical protein
MREKFKCEEENNGICSTRDYGLNQYKDACYHCCYNCQYAISMECTFVCSKVAEYYYPSKTKEEE